MSSIDDIGLEIARLSSIDDIRPGKAILSLIDNMIVRTVDELAAVVRARRHELGLTQEELAGVIGTHRLFVSQFERGKRSVRFELVLRLVQALGLDIELRPREQ